MELMKRRIVGTDEEEDCFVEDSSSGTDLIPGIEYSVEHALVEEAVAHPLGDDDVHLGHALGQRDLLNLAPRQDN